MLWGIDDAVVIREIAKRCDERGDIPRRIRFFAAAVSMVCAAVIGFAVVLKIAVPRDQVLILATFVLVIVVATRVYSSRLYRAALPEVLSGMGRCTRCGFDLTTVSTGNCPECGTGTG